MRKRERVTARIIINQNDRFLAILLSGNKKKKVLRWDLGRDGARTLPSTVDTIRLIRLLYWIMDSMSDKAITGKRPSPTEYLIISRGEWDKGISEAEIQSAIDQFYTWHDRLVSEGKMKPGQRLTYEGKTVTRKVITDGPFGESKEAIGGFWFVLAHDLEEAAEIAQGNPCLNYGLLSEIRPIDPDRATPHNTGPRE